MVKGGLPNSQALPTCRGHGRSGVLNPGASFSGRRKLWLLKVRMECMAVVGGSERVCGGSLVPVVLVRDVVSAFPAIVCNLQNCALVFLIHWKVEADWNMWLTAECGLQFGSPGSWRCPNRSASSGTYGDLAVLSSFLLCSDENLIHIGLKPRKIGLVWTWTWKVQGMVFRYSLILGALMT